jgi:hypothetical protein
MFGGRGRSEFGAGKYILIAFALIALEFILYFSFVLGCF